MRDNERIRDIIENRNSWQQLFPESEEEEKYLVETTSIKQATDNIKQNYPVFYDLAKHLIQAHNNNDQKEKQIVLEALKYYKENR